MPVAHRGQPEGVVVARVLVVADADIGGVEQVHDRRDHPLAAEASARHVLVDPLADLRQRHAEGDHPVVLGLVAHRPPLRVVAVLLAAARVAASSLQVAVRRRADPHVRPRRRDRQRLDLRDPLTRHRLAVGAGVLESLAAPPARDARLVVAHVAQPRRPSRQRGCDPGRCNLYIRHANRVPGRYRRQPRIALSRV